MICPSGSIVCTVPFPKVEESTDDQSATVVLKRAGQDLRGGSRKAAGQDDERTL